MTDNTYYNNSKSYQDLSEIIDPETFGHIIGAGSNTLVIKPYYEYWSDDTTIKRPVLFITKEIDKFATLEAIFKDTNLQIERINFDSISTEYTYPLEYLIEEGYDVFYTTELTPLELKYDSPIGTAMEIINSEYYHSKMKVEYLNPNIFADEIKEELINYYEGNESLITELDLEIIDSIESSLEKIKYSNIKSDFKLDIHTGQFVTYQDEVFCIDPLFFNYK